MPLSQPDRIGARKRAEEELRENEANLTALAENTEDRIWAVDADYRLIVRNPQFLQGLKDELKHEIALGKSVLLDSLPKAVQDEWRSYYDRALRGESFRVEKETQFYKERAFVDYRFHPIRSAEGKISGVVVSGRDITERKRVEEVLRTRAQEQEWLLRSMTNAFVIFQSVFDENGRFISYRFEYINDAHERITGAKMEEVRGKTVHEVWPEIEASWIEQYGAVAVSGIPRTFDMYHKPTAKLYHCHVYRPWETAERFCVIFEDITERKRVEEELRESEEKYRTLITQSPDGIFIVNLKGTFLAVNRVMRENLKYSEEELLSMSIWDIVPEQYVDLHKKRIADILMGKAPNEAAEYKVRGKDGNLFSVEILSAPYYKGKELIGFQGIARDITERKRAEVALRREQTMLARTEGIAQIGSWAWDIATDTVTWSDELFRIFQRDPKEGAPSFAEHPAFYHPDDMARLQQAVEVAVTLGTPYELELRAIRKDGETRVCMARGVAEMAPGGRAVHLFGSLQDITERKRLEQEATKARVDFLYAVSHELKTPLFLMASAQELLERLPAEQRAGRFLEYGEIWNRNLHRLRHLIDNLVDSQRTEGMGLKLAVVPTDLGEILRQTLKDVDFLARRQRIHFRLQEDPLPMIPADPESIHRLCENLLTNAIKFSSPDGEVEIELRRAEEEAVFTVRDFGLGIPASEIPLLFQPFQRTDSVNKAVIPGTGLGLYTAKLIAGAHGGSIALTSEEGKGTKVTVRLPLNSGIAETK